MKKTLFALLFLPFAARAEPTGWGHAACLASSADMLSTRLMLNDGGVEHNRLLGRHPDSGVLIADALGSCAVAEAYDYLYDGDPRIKKFFLVAATYVRASYAVQDAAVWTHNKGLHEHQWEITLVIPLVGALK